MMARRITKNSVAAGRGDFGDLPEEGVLFTDIHCHCLPGLDDGPASWRQTLALCEALVADRVGTVVATPHQLGRYDGRHEAAQIRQVVGDLNELLTERGVPLTVLPGADVRIDERMIELLEADRVLTTADRGRHVMLELPHRVFIDPILLLQSLGEKGYGVVITHPERHAFLMKNPAYVQRWAENKPCLQITAGCFVGEFGRRCQAAAWAFLSQPLPLLVATDAHDVRARPPRMTAAYRAICEHRGRAVADLLCLENPRRLVAGEDPLPIADSDGPGRPRY